VVITSTLFATFPMMFELWSYAATRFTVPLAALLAMLALTDTRPLLGAMLICAALATYQSAIYLAVVTAFYVTAYRTAKGEPAFRTFALPRAVVVLSGLALYVMLYCVMTYYFHVGGRRIANLVHIVSRPDQFVALASIILQATIELLSKGMFLFPAVAKYAFLTMAVILFGALAFNRSLVGIVLVCAAPLCVFGAAWVMFPPNPMLFDRILFSFVGVYTGTFLTAWLLTNGHVRSLVSALGALLVAIFILQANNWHQFMDLRNRADMDMTQLIAARIRGLPEYQPGMAITVIGTTQDMSYMPYRLFDTSRGLVGNTMLVSTYAYDWSTTRALMFYFPLNNRPSPAVVQAATVASTDMPVWPAPGSVGVRGQMVIVKLK
jgi:hypothetical protein